MRSYAGRKVDGDTAALRGRTVLFETLLGTVGMVVQAGSLSGLWLGRYGWVEILDFRRAAGMYR